MSVELKLPPIYQAEVNLYHTGGDRPAKSNLISDRYPEGAFRYDRCRTTPFPLWTEHKETCRYCNTQAG